MNKLMQNYNQAKKALYKHVGFVPDWVVCPIDDCTSMYWGLSGDTVCCADTLDEYRIKSGNYYEDAIYTQRFYSQWIYRGEVLTMIMCDPGVDGMKWFRFFSNEREMIEVDDAKNTIHKR